MNRNETKAILATIASVYPPSLMVHVTEATVNIWHQMLTDLDPGEVNLVIQAWVASNRYPPTINDIREKVILARSPEIDTAEEAWGKVMTAARVIGRNKPRTARAELGEFIWGIISQFGWDYYCNMMLNDENFYFSQFRRTYDAQVKRKTELAQLPPSLASALSRIGNGGQFIRNGDAR